MTDPILSVNLMIAFGMIGVSYWIYKILLLSHKENVSIQDKKNS